MKIRRTANAGVLIKTDGLSVLLDGVSKRVEFYMETPEKIKDELTEEFPDIVAFTHQHDDHYDSDYAKAYEKKTLRPVYGSEVFVLERNGVSLRAIPTRHIGKCDITHMSFILKGSKTVWFMGDASPLEWKNAENLPAPDVIIAPFAYANTSSAWKMTKAFNAKHIVILHLPERENDVYGLWDAVEKTVKGDTKVHIPKMGESIELN